MRPISKLILMFFVAEIIIFLISAGIPVNSPSLVQQYNSIESSIRNQSYISIALSIFANNIKVAILDFIPAIGIIMLSYSIVDTGMILSAVMTANHIPGIVAALALLTLPHSFVELPSYAIAAGSGTYILLRRKDWKRGLITFIIVPIELFLAALVEASLFFVPNPYIMWAASAPILVGLYFLYQYLQKIADKYVEVQQPVTQYYQQIPLFNPPDYQYYNQYRENWAKALTYESQGDANMAMNYLWVSLINLISAIAIKMGLPYYTKEDIDRVIQTLSIQNPQINYLYQQAFTLRMQDNYIELKQIITQLVAILQNIYQTSISRRIG
ncbi:stage II sporulation protein M [Sulfurisphaera javensis]